MKTLLSFLTIPAILLGFLIPASPAQAGFPGGVVQHAADDTGYNPPVFFRCDTGYVGSLGLGTSSRSYCGDVDAVWVGAGDNLICYDTNNQPRVFDPTGWNAITNFGVWRCYQRKD